MKEQLPDKKVSYLLERLKNNLKKKKILFLLLFIVLLFLTAQRVALVQVNGENRLLISKWPISEYDRKVIDVKPLGGVYYSSDLGISISLGDDLSGEEYRGAIWLRKNGADDFIEIGRYETDYTSLDDAHARTKNQDLKNGIRSNFATKYGNNGLTYKIKNSNRRISYLYFDSYIYFVETPAPELYDAQDSIARSLFFGNYYKDVFKLTPSPVRKKETFLTLQRKEDNNVKDIFRFERSSDIIRWQGYILYTYNNGENDVLSVYLHNLLTGETDVIFREENAVLYISDLNIINDVLYFNLGAYRTPGRSYWIDLHDYKRVNKLADMSGSILKINDMYYFMKGEGDACWGSLSISLFNIDKKSIKHIIDTVTGCISGDEYLGIDKNNQVVLASHEGAGEEYRFPVSPPSLYTKIFTVDSQDKSKKRDIISLDVMPHNILVVKYSQGDGELLLVGDSVYTYSFANSQLEKIVDFPKEWIDRKNYLAFHAWENDIVCVSKVGWDSDVELKMYVDLNARLVKSNHEGCPERDKEKSKYFDMSINENAEKVYENLDLPDNYSLVEK